LAEGLDGCHYGSHPEGTQKLEAAQRLLDFAASRSANEVYARFIQQVAIEGIAKAIPFYPEGVAVR